MQPRGVLSLASVFFGLVLALSSAGSPPAPAPASDSVPAFAVLVFTKTTGWRHESIAAGVAAIRGVGTQAHFAVDVSEDAAVFTRDQLAHYRVVMFLHTTGHILEAEQQAALEHFIRQGGGFVGIHSATDTEYDWPWYG